MWRNLDERAFKINDLPYFAGFEDGKLLEEFATAKKDRVTSSPTPSPHERRRNSKAHCRARHGGTRQA